MTTQFFGCALWIRQSMNTFSETGPSNCHEVNPLLCQSPCQKGLAADALGVPVRLQIWVGHGRVASEV